MSQQPIFATALTRFFHHTGTSAVGTGFLIPGNRVLTCAHVVQSCLPSDTPLEAGLSVELDLPYLLIPGLPEEEQRLTATLAAADHLDDDNGADIALLTLVDPRLPDGATPLPLLLTPDVGLDGHHYQAVGFPLGQRDGVVADGRIVALLPGERIQVAGEGQAGFDIEKGFSGGPLWDVEQNGVIGLIVTATDDRQRRTAFARPTSVLQRWQSSRQGDLPFVTTRDLVYQGSLSQIERGQSALMGDLDTQFVDLTLYMTQESEQMGRLYILVEPKPPLELNSVAALLAVPEISADPTMSLVILGGPGSGKSMLLRHHVSTHAQRDAGGPARSNHNEEPIPLFFTLNGYSGGDPAAWLADEWKQVKDHLARESRTAPHLPTWEALFGRVPLLIGLDGLNEMAHASDTEYRGHIDSWQRFLQRLPLGTRALFTCRTLDYSRVLDDKGRIKVKQVQLQPLTPEKIRQFLTVYIESEAERLWNDMREDRDLLDLYATPFFVRLLTAIQTAQRERVARSSQLIEVGAGLPVLRNRAALLTAFVYETLIRERLDPLLSDDRLLFYEDRMGLSQPSPATEATLYELPSEGPLILRLEQLAYRMQLGKFKLETERSLIKISARDGIERMGCGDDEKLGRDIMTIGGRLNILDRTRDFKQIYFYHHLIQEYFAARHIARQSVDQAGQLIELVEVAWRADAQSEPLAEVIERLDRDQKLPALESTGWDETFVLAAPMVPAERQSAYVEALAAVNLPLAARCAEQIGEVLEPGFKRHLAAALVSRMGDGEADLRARIAAAEAPLPDDDDPRFVLHPAGYIEPPMILIPGGQILMPPENAGEAEIAELGERYRYDVEPFMIGKYPVTNREYSYFMADGGYTDDRWWPSEDAQAARAGGRQDDVLNQQILYLYNYFKDQDEASIRARQDFESETLDMIVEISRMEREEFESRFFKQAESETTNPLTQPEYWDDPRFNHPRQPVAGVSYYEACAYTLWLSAKSGRHYDLPTEGQWQAAAGGPNGRNYPYGSRFDPLAGNTFETRIKQTVPVGLFPEGRSPEGVEGLSGNVWDWTHSLWGKEIESAQYGLPYAPDDGREDRSATAATLRVVRGGSWLNTDRLARAASRGRYNPSGRDGNYGFRLLSLPPSQ